MGFDLPIFGSPDGKASSQLTPEGVGDILKDVDIDYIITCNTEIAIRNRWLKIGE